MLHYQTPVEIANIAASTQRCAYYAFAELPNAPDGVWHTGEIKYSAHPNGEYTIHNTQTGRRDLSAPLEWLDSQQRDLGDGRTLEWTIVARSGDLLLFCFTVSVTPPRDIPPPVGFAVAVVDATHYGPLGFAEPSAVITERSLWDRLELPAHTYRSAGPLLWLQSPDAPEPVCVPKTLVSTLASEIVGKPRTAANFHTLINNARQHVRNSDIPARHKPLAIILSAAVAFTLHADREAAVVLAHTSTAGYAYDRLAHALTLPRLHAIPRFVGPLTSAILLTVGFMALSPWAALNWTVTLLAWAWFFSGVFAHMSVAGLLMALTFLYPTHVAAYSPTATWDVPLACAIGAAGFAYYYYSRRRVRALAPILTYAPGPRADVEQIRHIATHYVSGINTRTLLPASTVPLRVRPPPAPRRDFKLGPTIQCVGIIFAPCVPYSYCSNWHNELAFLRLRILRAVDPPAPGAYDRFMSWLDRCFVSLFPNSPATLPAVDQVAELRVWAMKFPAATRALLFLAADEYAAGNYVNWHRVYRHSAFVKREKSHKDGKPRGIQAAHALLNALNGPHTARFSRQMRASWTVDHFVTYAPGLNGCQIGAWADSRRHLLQVFPEDYALFDTTMSEEAQSAALYVAFRFRADPDYLQRVKDNFSTYGRTASGGSYVGKIDVKSGDTTTTDFNTVDNGLLKVYVFAPEAAPAPPYSQRFAAIVGGDDSLTLTLPGSPPPDLAIERSLGFQPEYEPACGIDDASFLSAFFVPACVDGVPQTVLAPKPGRILARFGWMNIPPQPRRYLDYVRGSALGLSDAFFLPYVGPFLARHIELTRDCVARDPRKHDARVSYVGSRRVTITQTPETWAWFSRRYRLFPSDELRFSALLPNVSSLPAEMPMNEILSIVERDVAPIVYEAYHDYRAT